MRIILKILLFPVVVLLTVVVAMCRFLCTFSTMLLSILAMVMFLLSLGTMIILNDVPGGLKAMLLAYLVSPFGIPLFASWLVEKVDDFNYLLKSI